MGTGAPSLSRHIPPTGPLIPWTSGLTGRTGPVVERRKGPEVPRPVSPLLHRSLQARVCPSQTADDQEPWGHEALLSFCRKSWGVSTSLRSLQTHASGSHARSSWQVHDRAVAIAGHGRCQAGLLGRRADPTQAAVARGLLERRPREEADGPAPTRGPLSVPGVGDSLSPEPPNPRGLPSRGGGRGCRVCSARLLWEADFAKAAGSADKGSGASRPERARPPERTRRTPPPPPHTCPGVPRPGTWPWGTYLVRKPFPQGITEKPGLG